MRLLQFSVRIIIIFVSLGMGFCRMSCGIIFDYFI